MNEQSVRGIWVLRWRFVAIGFASMLAVVSALLHGADVQAAEVESSPRVKLFRPDSLIGWNYGPTPPTGWTIEGGVLRGDQKASQLNSAWTFGDFDLAFAWTACDDGVWEIVLPMLHIEGQPPAGINSAVRILLKGKRDIEMLAPGAAASGSFAANDDGPFKTTIRRSGKTLTVQIGDGANFEVSVDPKVRLGLALKLSSGSGLLQNLTLSEPAGEAIFNGRDLAGWWTPGNRESWKVEDAQIVCLNNGGNYLRSEKEFGNFTLSLDYKMNKSVNSGVGIRTPRAGWPSSDGIEIQLEDKPGLDKHATMALYGNLEPLARADKSRQWNHAVVKAEGHIVTGWMNGELVQHSDTSTLAELKHRQLTGWIGLQDHGGRIWVRNMNVLEAPPGENPLLVGKSPYTPTPPERMLDRLMNCRRLAECEDLHSGVVQGRLAAQVGSGSDAPQVLAELTGPGALASLWQERDGGTLAFYFDGQSESRFSCSPADLPQYVPRIGEDASPLLTCVPFFKSLKITRTGGPASQYRVDYVAFPVQDVADCDATSALDIPRGALSAVDYRFHRLGGGTLRDIDPYQRLNAAPRAIEPGSSSQLLSGTGAGTVLWLKLIADPTVLENDDLWIEVTVDGEREPAVSAPARFWYPALAGGMNHDNFTQVSRDGFTSLLAMPFGHGFSVAVRNVGKKTIAAVGASASVQQTGTATMRLRGVFCDRQSDNQIFAVTGRGRWVALVSSARLSPAAGFGTLEVDGKPAAGWAGTTAAQFWGPAASEPDVFNALAGHSHGLRWRYLLLAPVDFQQSMVLKSPEAHSTGKSLALFYLGERE